MRPSAILPILLFLAPFAAADSRYAVDNVLFIPQTYYVGDRVELRLSIRTFAPLEAPSPRGEPPKVSWGEFHDFRVSSADTKWEIRLVFTPFQPGTHVLPVIRAGVVALEGIKVDVKSLVEEGHTNLSPPRGQALLPSTKLIFGLVVGGFIALPLFGTFSLIWVRPRLRRVLERYKAKRPQKRFLKALKALGAQMSELDGKRFYIALIEQIKIYLSLKTGVDCRAFTTREMEDYLRSSGADEKSREEILEIFVFGDGVKFAGRTPGFEVRKSHIDSLTEIASAMEKSERVHADI